jgi:hypothetical protein
VGDARAGLSGSGEEEVKSVDELRFYQTILSCVADGVFTVHKEGRLTSGTARLGGRSDKKLEIRN